MLKGRRTHKMTIDQIAKAWPGGHIQVVRIAAYSPCQEHEVILNDG
jgi:hypothetical protein